MFRIYTLLNLFYQEEYYLNISSVTVSYSIDNPNDSDEVKYINLNHPRKQFY